MSDVASLEIKLSRWSAGESSYKLKLDFRAPNVYRSGASGLVSFDFSALRAQFLDLAAYGRLLTQHVFAPPKVAAFFGDIRRQVGDNPLCLRLALDADVPELHELRWEILRDPLTDAVLTASPQVWFARYVDSPNCRPAILHSKYELSNSVAVASPSNLHDYQLSPLDVAGELRWVSEVFWPRPLQALPTVAARATLENVVSLARESDFFYLICHGRQVGGQGWVFLEDKNGMLARVSADQLAVTLGNSARLPCLLVMTACQSADAVGALGPRLAQAGVPAVLAMYGMVPMETARRFMTLVLSELRDHGQIDRAVAAARGALAAEGHSEDRLDAWSPVLFMRSEDGRLWDETRPVADRRMLKLKSSKNLADLSLEQQARFIAEVAGQLQVQVQAVETYRIGKGSLILELGMPIEGIQQLRLLMQDNAPPLRELEVERVLIEAGSGELEDWVHRDGRFVLADDVLRDELLFPCHPLYQETTVNVPSEEVPVPKPELREQPSKSSGGRSEEMGHVPGA